MKKVCAIKTLGGSANLRKESAKAHFFHVPHAGGKGNKEVFLDKAATNGVTGGQDGVVHRMGRAQISDAIPGTLAEIGGRVIAQTFMVAEGEVIKCFINVRRSYGKLPRTASVYVRVRDGAAYRKLRFRLTNHADTILTHAEIEGTFDILSTDEVVGLGVSIPNHYRSFSDATNIATVLEENIVIREEVEARTKLESREVSDGKGGMKTIITRKRRRVLE